MALGLGIGRARPLVSGATRAPDLMPALMLAAVVATSLVIVAHLAVILWLSAIASAPGSPSVYGWANYVNVFTDERTAPVIANTLGFAFVSLGVALGFGVPAAWLVERTDLKGKSVLFTAMTLGLLIPDFAAAMGWLFLLHPRIGLLNVWLMGMLHLRAAPFDILGIVGMGWVQGLNLAPLAFIMTAAVFRSLDPALEEAAQTSRASPIATFVRITVPLAWPGILAAAIYIFTIGFAAFDVPAIIGWSGRVFTFSTYLYLLLNPQDVLPRYGAAAALGTAVMALAAALSWWYARMQRRHRFYAVVTGKAYRPRAVRLGRCGFAAWGFLGAYLLISKLVPIALLAWASLLPYFQLPSARAIAVLSLEHYRNLPWDLALGGLGHTALLMLLTPTATLALSLAFSWIVLRSRIPGRAGFDFVAFLPHAIPNIIFGVGALLIALYVVQLVVPIYGTVWILLVVFTIARLSYGTRMTNSGLIQIHTELEESAQVGGASTWGVFRFVLVPLLAPTLLYAWLWVALLTFRELTLAVVLSTSGNLTLPVVIWSLWLGGSMGQSSALAMIMLALMVPVTALYWPLARRHGLLAP